MADSSDSEFSEVESEGDLDIEDDMGESSSEEEVEEQYHANPWFRIRPPELEEQNQDNRFREESGPRNPPPANASPIQYFLMFLTVDFLRQLVRETNRYAQELIESRARISRFSRLHSWYKVGIVTYEEMKGFISVILNMGLVRKPSIKEYWNTKFASQDTAWFRRMFSRNRFQNILKFFHVVDNNLIPNRNDPGYSPASKFQPIVDLFNYQSKAHRIPKQHLSIDESLVAAKGRSSIIQYIPTKAAKFGVKLWVLAEAASGYVMHIDVYKGKRYDPTPRRMLQGTYVVNKLLAGANLLNKWYHVITDSFFTSVSLAKELYNNSTFYTGTIRSNRRIPDSIKKSTLGEKDSIFVRQGAVLLCAYKERNGRKPVRLLSTKCKALVENEKPKVVSVYNKLMGGVDLSDMMVETYSDDRKSVKVWKKIVFNIINRMVLNAYLIYEENTSDNPKKCRLAFTQCLIEELAKPLLQSKILNNNANNAQNVRANRNRDQIRLRKLPGSREKDCDVCSDRTGFGGRRRSKTVCSLCGKGLHKNCQINHICIEQ